jgi:ABC-2 type transport system permease protein
MSALGKLTVVEAKLFSREPAAAVYGLAFPVVLLVIFGSLPSMRAASSSTGGLRVIDVYLPILIGLGLATLALNTLPGFLANYREKGVLRRLSTTTPVSPAGVLTAQLVVNVTAAMVSVALLVGIGHVAFGVALPRQFLGFLLTLVLLATSLYTLGLLVASVAPTNRAAAGIGTLLYLPMMFTAGLWTPGFTPGLIHRIGEFTPLGAGVQALQQVWAGHWPQPLLLLVLAGYTVVVGALAARLFRWE